jgi:hypothetical protein
MYEDKENTMKRSRVFIIIAVSVVLLLGTVYIVLARSNPNGGVLPPASRVQGLAYEEWLARWWQYALVTPSGQNPISGETGNNCVYQRIGNVGLLLANSTLTEPIVCEVPNGMMLFVEVLGAECSTMEEAPFFGGNEAELRTCAQAFIPQDLVASIDGVDVKNLDKYVFISPAYDITAPENNILGAPGGTVGKSVGSGAYLMISPLSVGKHTLHLKGTYPTLEYTADKTFDLTVSK